MLHLPLSIQRVYAKKDQPSLKSSGSNSLPQQLRQMQSARDCCSQLHSQVEMSRALINVFQSHNVVMLNPARPMKLKEV